MDLPTAPRVSTRTTLAVALVVLALLVASTCGEKDPDTRPDDIERYVSLGDSYTAGVGLKPLAYPACLRSEANYPNLVAKQLDVGDLVDVSCGGASSTNLTQIQKLPDGSNPPQLDSVTVETDLVTLGLGFNDFGLAYYLLYACLPVKGTLSAGCAGYLKQPQGVIDAVIRNVGVRLRSDLDAIRERAPKARIVLVGYPRFLPDEGSCSDQVPLPDAALGRIRVSFKKVSEEMERAARNAKVDYVDMYSASGGHDVCSDEPWVNGQYNRDGIALAFHPFVAYHEAVADKLESLLAKK